MNKKMIDDLANAKGIETNYRDAWGKDMQVDTRSKASILQSMGYDISSQSALNEQLEQEKQDFWLTALDPVKVFRQKDSFDIEVRVPIALATETLTLSLTCENAQTPRRFPLKPVDCEMIDVAEIDGYEYQEYLSQIPIDCELGYHTLQLLTPDGQIIGEQLLIVAPDKCYQHPAVANGGRVWGINVQLYCLRSEHNFGIGNFTDLKQLIEQSAETGCQFIGLNPIHALYPNCPESASPYSPSSRRWLNIMYIDPLAVAGFDACKRAQSLYHSSGFQKKLASARAAEYVDYLAVSELNLPLLKILHQHFRSEILAKDGNLTVAYKNFLARGGEPLKQQAVFDAIQETLTQQGINAWGWPSWPEALNRADKPAVAEFAEQHAELVDFYIWCQWLAQTQLDECQQLALDKGMKIGLYRDLAVGVSSGSAEIWANHSIYCHQVSVGAPPDPLGPLGQNWGLPPIEPNRLYQQKYQTLINLYRDNMRACGALRIDHVMALLRLWWVPKDAQATDGAYVYYPIDDILGILCLESHRNKCMVVGEDLGTVPDGIREIFAENGLYSYKVFFFETAEDGGYLSPAHYPSQSLAALTTHDLPTLPGFWECEDLKLGERLGIYQSGEQLDGLFHQRHHAKQRILDSLHGHGVLPDDFARDVFAVGGMDWTLNSAFQCHLASTQAAFLSLQLEDALQMYSPVNVPGTSDEYPNWRRKLSRNLVDIFNDEKIMGLYRKLNQIRITN
ncbi:4-alpha-glucanotransferase [Gayadomonas joobiniege]|uniref:4-alpha-glucanotransferase n=1 Tax=Gayadomonas joobiniege TaxID=1234606 RepID=UPI0003605EEF|nr:4-alpha-glucanotransferase [Gayadomonas joobiniege]